MKKLLKLFAIIFSVTLIIGSTACGKENNKFYDKVVEDFGVIKNIPDYEVNSTVLATSSEYVHYHGRYYVDGENNAVWISFTNAGFEVTFYGTTLEGDFLATRANDVKSKPYVAVAIDGDYDPDHATPIQFSSKGKYKNSTGSKNGYTIHEHVVLACGLDEGVHTARIYKRSECQNSRLAIRALSTDGEMLPVTPKSLDLKIEVFGDSVSCGYAVESDDFYENFTTRTENGMKTYANYAANLLNADISTVAAGGYPMYQSIYSAGNKPDNIPAMFSMAEFEYHTSFDHAWDNSLYVPDVVIIALGANDGSVLSGLYGKPDYYTFLQNFERTYREFVDKILETYPETLVIISDEILKIADEFTAIADSLTNEYQSNGKNVIRAKLNAYDLSKDRILPGSGHPNNEMHEIAGHELARIIADKLSVTLNDSDFWTRYDLSTL